VAWTGFVKKVEMRDEKGRSLYSVERLYDSQGRALHDPITRYGFQYKIVCLETGKELGVSTYLGTAKEVAERHFAKAQGGKHTGYWTSCELTRQLGAQLG
jgi:hypothetical protein